MLYTHQKLRLHIFLLLITTCFSGNLFAQTNHDKAVFQLAFKNFQSAVRHKDLTKAGSFLHFPFFTAKSDQVTGKEHPADAIGKQDFERDKNAIFNTDVRRILPKLGEDAISEILADQDSYYASLKKASDPGSKLYEVYAQYPKRDGGSESYFGFVFAKIKGRYSALAYYGKWPLR